MTHLKAAQTELRRVSRIVEGDSGLAEGLSPKAKKELFDGLKSVPTSRMCGMKGPFPDSTSENPPYHPGGAL